MKRIGEVGRSDAQAGHVHPQLLAQLGRSGTLHSFHASVGNGAAPHSITLHVRERPAFRRAILHAGDVVDLVSQLDQARFKRSKPRVLNLKQLAGGLGETLVVGEFLDNTGHARIRCSRNIFKRVRRVFHNIVQQRRLERQGICDPGGLEKSRHSQRVPDVWFLTRALASLPSVRSGGKSSNLQNTTIHLCKFEMEGSVPLARSITLPLEAGTHMELLRAQRGGLVRRVDFANARVASYTTDRHSIYLSPHILASHPVVVLFPNHRERADPRMQVLRSDAYRSRDEFNRTLARRFEESLERTDEGQYTRLAVCYGPHIYICDGFTGTPYVLWAEHIKTERQGTVPNTLRASVPLVLNMDGQGRVKALYLLPEHVESQSDLQRVPITRWHVELLFDARSVPFVNEKRPPSQPHRRVPMQSRMHALASLRDLTKRGQRERAYHAREAAHSVDGEFSQGIEITLDYEDDGEPADDGIHDSDGDPLGVVAALADSSGGGGGGRGDVSEYDDGADPFT